MTTYELPPQHQNAIRAAVDAVSTLIVAAGSTLSHEGQQHLATVLQSDTHVDVHFRLLHGATQIIALIQDVVFFTVEVGASPEEEETRH